MIIAAAKAREAAEALGVELEGLTPSSLNIAFRNAAKDCHPDHHGTSRLDKWSRTSWAKEILFHWLKQNPVATVSFVRGGDCEPCDGTGRVKVGFSWGRSLEMVCGTCKGEGSVPKED